MSAIILTAHTLIVLGLIVVVLLQRSDGGALGIGGGAGGGGFMTGRGAANALTRTTSVLAALFFATSLGLAILAGNNNADDLIIEELTGEAAPTGAPGEVSADDLLGTLGGASEDDPDAVDVDPTAPASAQDLDAALDALGAQDDPAPASGDEGADEDAPQ